MGEDGTRAGEAPLVTSAFALLYKWMPPLRLHRRDFWTGDGRIVGPY